VTSSVTGVVWNGGWLARSCLDVWCALEMRRCLQRILRVVDCGLYSIMKTVYRFVGSEREGTSFIHLSTLFEMRL